MKKSTRLISILIAILTLTFLFSVSGSATSAKQSTLLRASNISNGIQLKWDAVENASYYVIYRRETTEKKKTCIAKIEETQFVDENTVAGKRYGYRVVPVLSNSKTGTNSNDLYINRLGTPRITKTSNTLTGIRVKWTASAGADGYRLYRKAVGEKSWRCVAKTNAKTLIYNDKNVNATASYSYAVRGYRSTDLSHPSNYARAHFTPAPKITKAIPNKTNVAIYWEKSEKAVSYQLYRKASTEKSYSLIQTLDATQLKYYDTDVKAGTLYSYLLRVVNSDKQVSAVANTPTKCLFMKMPTLTKAQNASNGVKLTWSKSDNAQGYYIYRRESSATAWKRVLNIKNVGTLSTTDKTAKNGKEYVYVIRAVWNGYQSAYDAEGITIRFLTPPQNLKVQAKGSSGNYLTWTANKSAAKYQVLRKTDKTAWTSLGFTTKTVGLDKTGKEGTVYTYAVRAYYGNFCSAVSNTASSSKINPKGKMVALTYDDGPSNSVTNDILDILEKYDSKATFFVIGSRINSSYQPMQRAVKMGCEIGNHTYSHINLPSYYYDDIRYEIDTTNSLVKKYTGVTPKIVRAPGGSTDSYSRQAVNMPFIYWSIDTRDWESRSASSVISIVKSNVEDGDIILMHDIYDSTAVASETIIPWLINQGYQLVTVSELMQYKGIKMQNAVSYSSAY